MITITLEPILHRGEERISICYPYSNTVNQLVRALPGAKWSQTWKRWHLSPDSVAQVAKLYRFRKFGSSSNQANSSAGDATIFRLIDQADIDFTRWDAWLQNRRLVQAGMPVQKAIKLKPQQVALYNEISPSNLQELEKMVLLLKGKAYSTSTITTYRNEFIQLLKLINNKPVYELTTDDLKRYLVHIMEKEGVSENTAHSRINALKFYFEQVLKRDKFFFDIPRPKKPQQLPKLLNEDEIARLFNALQNKKHKAMLFTAYSAGLRVSEVANLKIEDIDSGRMQIRIERAKGKKDRYVTLSPMLLDILRNYYASYKPTPKKYVFESEQTGTAYPTRTIQQVFSNAKEKAGIRKEVGVHSLRHSFATHLLDKGVDIRYIKDILGHFNIKTTERYLHVSKQQLINISSPFDDLFKKKNIDW